MGGVAPSGGFMALRLRYPESLRLSRRHRRDGLERPAQSGKTADDADIQDDAGV
jgi:hypothetical protein